MVFYKNGLVEERADLTSPPRPATLTALAPKKGSLSQINCLSRWELVKGVLGECKCILDVWRKKKYCVTD